MLAEICILEENIETYGGSAPCGEVAHHVRVDGTVPFVVVAELGERGLVDVDNEDIGVVSLGYGDFVVGVVFFFVDAGHCLEKEVVEVVFYSVGATVRDVEKIVLRTGE